MKVGIITFTVENFGAQLQAYALQTYLSHAGYDAEICDLQIEAAPKEIRRKVVIQEWTRALFSVDFGRTLKRIACKVLKINSGGGDFYIDKAPGCGFKEFKKDFLVSSKRVTARELRGNPNMYDIYITGSDQVWSYSMSSILDIYYLDFTKNKRVSYAASFGHNSIPRSFKEEISGYLDRMNSISVRENQGVDLAKSLTKNKVCKVVDPTFLLSLKDWATIFDDSKTPDTPYIFVYDLIHSEYLSNYTKWIAEKLGCQVITSAHKTPQQFISLIAHAKWVITTSFHGMALSTNFKVPFTVICRKSKTTNARMTDLCNQYGMSDNVLFEGDSFKIPVDVDFDDVHKKLSVDVMDSKQFISDSI